MTSVRTLGLLLCLAVPAFAAEEQQIRLAAPGLSAVNLDEKMGTFLAEHFAQRLSLEGIRVITASEVQALVGVERQRQLLGCSEGSSSCLTELADALGADGVISGSVAKLGSIYQVNIKILSANDARALAIVSRKAFSDEDLIEMLNEAAEEVAGRLKDTFRERRERAQAARAETNRRPQADEDRDETEPEREAPATSTDEDDRAPITPMKKPQRMNALHINALGVGAGYFGFEYERALGTNLTIVIAPAYAYPYLFGGLPGLEVVAGARWYLSGDAPAGFALGASVLGGIAQYFSVSFRAEALYHFALGDHFLLGLGAMIGRRTYTDAFFTSGVEGSLRLSLGARF